MGLDEASFDQIVKAGCPSCGGRALAIESFIDQRLLMMLGEPNDAGRFVHDGEKFVDGTYAIDCAACQFSIYTRTDCPRCHAAGGLATALASTSKLEVPKRCPKCNELELLALALVPASARYGGEPPKPKALVEFGDAGHHVVAYACESCDAAVVAQRCPLCDAPGPLRARP